MTFLPRAGAVPLALRVEGLGGPAVVGNLAPRRTRALTLDSETAAWSPNAAPFELPVGHYPLTVAFHHPSA